MHLIWPLDPGTFVCAYDTTILTNYEPSGLVGERIILCILHGCWVNFNVEQVGNGNSTCSMNLEGIKLNLPYRLFDSSNNQSKYGRQATHYIIRRGQSLITCLKQHNTNCTYIIWLTLAKCSSSSFMSTICIPISSIIALGLYLISSRALSSILYWNSRDKQVHV